MNTETSENTTSTEKPPSESDTVTCYESLAQGMAEKTDKSIAEAITSSIGDGWNIAELKGRLGIVRLRNAPKETLTLDGKPIMELYPVELTTEQRGSSTVITAAQNYRTLSHNVLA
jgi:hypothetical protein